MRSWNVFHGNASPPVRRSFLEDMVGVATQDEPDVLLLQEVPAWALSELPKWSGMTTVGDVAARPRIGPLPSTAVLGRFLTSAHPGVLRSAFAGQANAVLVGRDLDLVAHDALTLNSRGFRRAQARWLHLPPLARWAWAKERRICQAVRTTLPDGRSALFVNVHATGFGPDERLADGELLRAAVFADALARPDEICVLGGDFNVAAQRSWTLRELAGAEWGFSRPGEGIDHLLVRGAPATRPERWPRERRRLQGHVLSDHAPVEIRIG